MVENPSDTSMKGFADVGYYQKSSRTYALSSSGQAFADDSGEEA